MIALHTLSAVACLAYGFHTPDMWTSIFVVAIGITNLYCAIIGAIEEE